MFVLLKTALVVSMSFHSYTVVSGDNLSVIGQANHVTWQSIYQANRGIIGSNPNLIFPGQSLRIPPDPPSTVTGNDGDNDSDDGTAVAVTNQPVSGGTLSCSGLESLWISAGGNPGSAFIAAEIAKAESGGNQYATGPAGERGYWQINPVNGSLSTYNAYGNARAAVIMSGNGTNWGPWTTYTQGLYAGRC